MATEVKIKELSMNYFCLGENNQVQKVSLKYETMREKLCSIFTEIALNVFYACNLKSKSCHSFIII